jgi:quinol monooxygenase YgiN
MQHPADYSFTGSARRDVGLEYVLHVLASSISLDPTGGSMIHVIATIELHPGKRERFLPEFSQLVPQVRAERGCIEYGGAIDLTSGLSAQVPIRPDVVIVVEKWSSLEALSAHLAAPHMKAYRERIKAFVVGTTLQVLAPVGEPAA